MTLPRPSWVRLNHVCTGVGLVRSTMHKGLVLLVNCSCGAEEQTVDLILTSWPYTTLQKELGLATHDFNTVDWLQRTAPSV